VPSIGRRTRKDPVAYLPNELLGRLVGFRMYSVTLVMDYVQLGFDSASEETATMNCDVWPEITVDGAVFHEPDLGYTDALRGLIPGIVLETRESTGLGLLLVLDTGSIRLHPRIEEVHAEIAMLSGFSDGSWMVWRPGEDSFEDIR
jgi:hypothetical protein